MASSFSARQMQETRLAATYKLRRELNRGDRSLRRTLAHVSLLEALDECQSASYNMLRHQQSTPIQTVPETTANGLPSPQQHAQPEYNSEDHHSDDEPISSSGSDSASDDEELSDWDDDDDEDLRTTIYGDGDDLTVVRILSNAATLSDIEGNDHEKSASIEGMLELGTTVEPKADLTSCHGPPAYSTISVDVQECEDDF